MSNDKHSHPVRSHRTVCSVCVLLHQQPQSWPCQTIKVTQNAKAQNGRKRQRFIFSLFLCFIPLSGGFSDLCMQEQELRKLLYEHGTMKHTHTRPSCYSLLTHTHNGSKKTFANFWSRWFSAIILHLLFTQVSLQINQRSNQKVSKYFWIILFYH